MLVLSLKSCTTKLTQLENYQKKLDRNPLYYIIQVISHVICLPYVWCSPEDISQMRVGDGETNHWNNIGYQEKHNLRISCIKISGLKYIHGIICNKSFQKE